jgi:hypothetical protein
MLGDILQLSTYVNVVTLISDTIITFRPRFSA